MGKKLLLENSPTGVQHYVEVDEEGYTAVEFTPSKVEQTILDDCAFKRSLAPNPNAHFRHAASVPIGLHTLWKKEWREKHRDSWTWQTFLAMKLNSRDYENLRTGHKDGKGMKL